MDLIIKPTEACNFACSFCSSSSIASSKKSLLDLDKIFKFLKRFPETRTIIVNGGDPLMVNPSYYWKILKYLEDNSMDTILSFTTNLWDFYKQPNKWIEIFKHRLVGVSTSFNYGGTRRITSDKIYTEELFWEVSDLFLKEVGYRPSFIAVINDDNYDSAIDNVQLAKRMNVECKLNYAMASGEQSVPLTLSKIYKIYLDIYDQGLAPWEFNTKQMLNRVVKESTVCPQNRSCDQGIRCLQPDGDYYSCGAFGDDQEHEIDFEREMNSSVVMTPLSSQVELLSMKQECFTCPMFEICNGCKKTIQDHKRHNKVEEHCSLMKTLAPRILLLKYAKKIVDSDVLGPRFKFQFEDEHPSVLA